MIITQHSIQPKAHSDTYIPISHGLAHFHRFICIPFSLGLTQLIVLIPISLGLIHVTHFRISG
jgi:hypothetical protein